MGSLGSVSSLALATVLLVACGDREQVDLVLDNVTIVHVEDGRLSGEQAVVVDDGVVLAVVPSRRTSGYEAATVVDAQGSYLMPALADAHVHVQYPSELESYVRHGVGLVVNMAGAPAHLALRAEVEEGRRTGPKIVTAGPTLDGSPPTNPLFTSVSPETAAEVVAWIAERGYDAIKVYQQVDAETLSAIVEAARSKGLITSGHVSRVTGVRGAIDAGLHFVAHGEELAFESFDEDTRRFDRGRIPALVELVSENGVTVTPMINYLEQVPGQVLALEEFLASDAMSLMPAGMRLSFGARQGWFAGRDQPEAFAEQMADVAGFVAELTAELSARGVPLILGTDAGFGGAIPGLSVHQELEGLVRAGLSELEALQTATLNVGRYLERVDPDRSPWGRIAPGADADLLLLAENPLASITATRAIEGVALSGRWISLDALEELEQRLRERQSLLMPLAERFEDALVAGDPVAARDTLQSATPSLGDDALISPSNCIFLGYRFFYRGQRRLAGELYEICAEMHPEAAELWWHIGQAREDGGDRDSAIEAYSRAHRLNPWYQSPAEAIRRLEQPGD